jgi:hypothetical protein
MDLNSGKPDWRELAPLMGLVFLLVIPAMVGGAMMVANWPSERSASGWAALWFGGGAVLVVVFGSFIWTLHKAIAREINGYIGRKEDWHYAELEKYQQGNGTVSAVQISEWTYTQTDVRHVALLYFYLMVAQPKSLSIEQLTRGGLFVRDKHRAFKMLEFTQDGAANALNLLADAGLIQGRGSRKAGAVAVLDGHRAAVQLLSTAASNPAVMSQGE